MTRQPSFLRNAVTSGAVASLLSTAVLVSRGRSDAGSRAAPFNAVSHWLFGDKAYHVDQPDLPHTALGVAMHQLSGVFWGLLFEGFLHRISRSDNPPRLLAAGANGRAVAVRAPNRGEIVASAAVTTAIAALTDLRLVPARLSPGFEHRLRTDSLILTYVVFGAGLALGAAALRRD